MNHIPRKRFGQNFLTDTSVIHRLVKAINPLPGEHLVEIGPGLGALTTQLLPLIKEMEAIELDRDLIAPLIQTCARLGTLKLHSADALYYDFTQLTNIPNSLRIVGNLPYQISTPLLFHLIDHIAVIKDLHFMLQKEVVDRLAAKTSTKDYGRLSVMIQYYFDVEPLFIVKPESFYPIPKVTSAVVRLAPKPILTPTHNFPLFEKIVKQAFNYRRKTLTNCLKGLVEPPQLVQLGIDPQNRPENISVEDFVKMSNLSPE